MCVYGGGERGAGPSPIMIEGVNIPFGPPAIIHPPFFQFLRETGENYKGTKLKGKIIINVTLI